MTLVSLSGDIADHCTALREVNRTNFAISLLLLIGILISYLPQHIRIIARRSSFGISPYFVLLGTTSGTCAFANILVLPTSRADMSCCHELDGFPCFAGLLGIAQVGMQWSCFTIILLLFLIFFPRATPTPTNLPPSPPTKPTDTPSSLQPTFRTALLVALTCLLHALIILILSLYFILLSSNHHLLQSWANFLGIFSTILSAIQYFPQIYTTFMLKRVGSLSIPMMCIQTPGSFVWAASLAARLGPEGWSAWGVYCVTGCLQGTLLVMGSYFEVVNKRREKMGRGDGEGIDGNGNVESESDTVVEPDERTSLLRRDSQ